MEYQFITVTYNHELIIQDHLNSIRQQVLLYGKGLKTFLTILDDCSNDNNVQNINDWLEDNGFYFEKVNLVVNELNLGIKENFLKANSLIEKSRFKILAGDDLYYSQNSIFEFMDYCIDKSVVFSPILYDLGIKKYFDPNFRKLYFYQKYKFFLRFMITRRNIFPAPGSFVSIGIVQSEEYINHLKTINWPSEDVPTWIYCFLIKQLDFNFYTKCVVVYKPSWSRLNKPKSTMINKILSVIINNIKPLNLMMSLLNISALIYSLFMVKTNEENSFGS
jgi:hypothetical protein